MNTRKKTRQRMARKYRGINDRVDGGEGGVTASASAGPAAHCAVFIRAWRAGHRRTQRRRRRRRHRGKWRAACPNSIDLLHSEGRPFSRHSLRPLPGPPRTLFPRPLSSPLSMPDTGYPLALLLPRPLLSPLAMPSAGSSPHPLPLPLSLPLCCPFSSQCPSSPLAAALLPPPHPQSLCPLSSFYDSHTMTRSVTLTFTQAHGPCVGNGDQEGGVPQCGSIKQPCLLIALCRRSGLLSCFALRLTVETVF